MKKTAVLLDLGFVLYILYRALGKRSATATEVHDFACTCLAPDEELFRIYAYHCPPFEGTEQHPISHKPVNFKKSATYDAMSKFLRELSLKDNVAFRAGEITFDGWVIKKHAARDVVKTGRQLQEKDFSPELKQKRVDIKIGLDVAWLASKSIVDRIILVTGDSDFVPAMKFARREGVQIILVSLSQHTKVDLRIHADELRQITYP
ncbi:MAG: NYN domain-containing protein [Candidatus Thiodiazotropha endolucinida]